MEIVIHNTSKTLRQWSVSASHIIFTFDNQKLKTTEIAIAVV